MMTIMIIITIPISPMVVTCEKLNYELDDFLKTNPILAGC